MSIKYGWPGIIEDIGRPVTITGWTVGDMSVSYDSPLYDTVRLTVIGAVDVGDDPDAPIIVEDCPCP